MVGAGGYIARSSDLTTWTQGVKNVTYASTFLAMAGNTSTTAVATSFRGDLSDKRWTELDPDHAASANH